MDKKEVEEIKKAVKELQDEGYHIFELHATNSEVYLRLLQQSYPVWYEMLMRRIRRNVNEKEN